MQKNPFGWVELPVTDLDRAEAFYKALLGFSFDRQEERNGYTMSWFSPMDMESYGAAGTLIKGNTYIPSHEGTLVYFTAPESVDASVEKALSLNAKILTPKQDLGEHGFFAIIEDSEGNSIAIHSMKG